LSQLFPNSASKSDKGGNTRLELFIAKSIVKVHNGGKKWAENNNNNTDDKKIILIEKKDLLLLPFTLLYFINHYRSTT
jgi:signal transduction histidine kinase